MFVLLFVKKTLQNFAMPCVLRKALRKVRRKPTLKLKIIIY